MKPEDAIQIIEQGLGSIQANLQVHQQMQTALQVVKSAIKIAETLDKDVGVKKDTNTKKEKTN